MSTMSTAATTAALVWDGAAGVATATATAPSNIAVVKYWGKRCSKHNLPINSSLSVTLDRSHLSTVTTVAASRAFATDRLWLNGSEELDVAQNKRVVRVLAEIRARARDLVDPATGEASDAVGSRCWLALLARAVGSRCWLALLTRAVDTRC